MSQDVESLSAADLAEWESFIDRMAADVGRIGGAITDFAKSRKFDSLNFMLAVAYLAEHHAGVMAEMSAEDPGSPLIGLLRARMADPLRRAIGTLQGKLN